MLFVPPLQRFLPGGSGKMFPLKNIFIKFLWVNAKVRLFLGGGGEDRKGSTITKVNEPSLSVHFSQ